MNKETPNPVELGDGEYTIGTVANITGVNTITLRAWERRYQLLDPSRQARGHRLYTQQHIDQVTRVVSLLDSGLRIGQVKASLEGENSNHGSQPEKTRDSWTHYLDNMIAAVIRFEETALEEAYDSALSLYPTSTVTEKLLVPALAELEQRWASEEGSIAEEHFFYFYLRNKLGAHFHQRFTNSNGPTLLMACLPGERRETGLLLTALAATEMGYHTILLGSDLPLEELPCAAKKIDCDAVILSAMIAPKPNILNESLAEVSMNVGVPVFLGGEVSDSANNILQKIGIHALGTDLHRGLQRVSELVPLRL